MNLQKTNLFQSFKSAKFKYGGFATLSTIIVLAVLVVVNLIFEQIPLKVDLSEDQMFTLSKQSYQVMDGLNQDVVIYGLYQPGKEDPLITEILKKYRDHTRKITLKYVDPEKNPGFAKQFTTGDEVLTVGSVIVTSGKKFKVIPSADLFLYDQSNYQDKQITSLAAEQRITGAILYATTEKRPVVYMLQGHGESSLSEELAKQFETENYLVKDLTLFTKGLPEDAQILVIFSPEKDLTVEETNRVREFLDREGQALILADLVNDPMPNLQSLLKSYGVSLERSMVIEDDADRHAGNPVFIFPDLNEKHSITSPLISSRTLVLVPGAVAIKALELKKSSLQIEPLLTTSNKSWAKTDLNSTSLVKGDSDPQGPFDLAVAITDDVKDLVNPKRNKTSRLVVIGNGMFLSPDFTGRVPGNTTFIMNCLSWLQGNKESLSIQPKNLLSLRLNFTGLSALLYAGLVVILIPLIVLGVGLFVWLRRRHL